MKRVMKRISSSAREFEADVLSAVNVAPTKMWKHPSV